MIDFVKIAEKIKSKEFAPGIPTKGLKRDIPTTADAQSWIFSEQHHDAKRAGPHSDLRLSDGTVAFSWAVPKGLPDVGGKALALRTNDHTVAYMRYAGPLGKGYGEGMVTLKRLGPMKVLSSSPDVIKWTALDKKSPQNFLMFRIPGSANDGWIIKNVTK